MELSIRKMRESDLESLHFLLSDPEVMQYLEPPFSMEKTEQFLKTAGLTEKPLIYAVEKDSEFIGYVIYHDYDNDSVEIGWVLYPKHWGKGYASLLTAQMIDRAFSEGKDIVIECAPEQKGTRHIAEKCGFEYIGIEDELCIYKLKR